MFYQCLIVDDEKELADSTAKYFNLFEVAAKAVYDAKSCLEFFEQNQANLILLDINLEESSGFDLCHNLRQITQVPILFISARGSDDDVILALKVGGDDYVKKPYCLSVLLAKVKAVLKRYGSTEEKSYSSGNLKIDFFEGKVWLNERPLKLKAQEYKLLCYLVKNRGRVLKKEELFEKVWGDTITSDGTLNVHIRHLREKIEADPNEPKLIQTIWGVGYVFEDGEGQR